MRTLPQTLFLLPLVVGVGPVAATPTPLCDGSCEVWSHSIGYLPPVVVLTSGSTVTWTSLDTSHVDSETLLLDDTAPCFTVSSDIVTPTPPVRFDVVAGALVATTDPAGPAPLSATCRNAVPAGPTGAALNYHCVLHPEMRGVLVVRAP